MIKSEDATCSTREDACELVPMPEQERTRSCFERSTSLTAFVEIPAHENGLDLIVMTVQRKVLLCIQFWEGADRNIVLTAVPNSNRHAIS